MPPYSNSSKRRRMKRRIVVARAFSCQKTVATPLRRNAWHGCQSIYINDFTLSTRVDTTVLYMCADAKVQIGAESCAWVAAWCCGVCVWNSIFWKNHTQTHGEKCRCWKQCSPIWRVRLLVTIKQNSPIIILFIFTMSWWFCQPAASSLPGAKRQQLQGKRSSARLMKPWWLWDRSV